MQRYILRRLLQAIVSLFFVTIIVFILSRLAGSPVNVLMPPEATAADIARLTAKLGLDKPLYTQYWLYISSAVRGDFGQSVMSQRPVAELIFLRLPRSLQLAGLAAFVSLAIALPVGAYAAVKRGKVIDLLGRLFAVLGQALPSFVVGLMLIMVFAVWLEVLPAGGTGGPEHFILPAIGLGWYMAAGIMRLMRSSMLDALGTEYIKLARIKGVSEQVVVWKHAFKNALLPVLTYAAMMFVIILAGAVVIETVFSWPGVARLVIESVRKRDFPVVQAVVLLLAALYIGVNFMVDILYAYLNPKIRYG